MRRLGSLILIAGATLALSAPLASGAANPTEYAAQVNPICVAAKAQAAPIVKRYNEKLKASAKGNKKPKLNLKAFERVNKQLLAISDGELAQIRTVLPAPGFEVLANSWISNRTELLRVERRISTLFVDFLRLPSPKPSKKGQKPSKADKKALKIFGKLFPLLLDVDTLEKADYGLGTQLGLTECVTLPGKNTGFSSGASVARSVAGAIAP
jgi:hypothetical protein